MRLEGEARPAVRRGRIAMRRAFVVPRALRGQRLGLASGLTLLASRKLQPGKAESWYLGRGAVQTRLFFKRGVASVILLWSAGFPFQSHVHGPSMLACRNENRDAVPKFSSTRLQTWWAKVSTYSISGCHAARETWSQRRELCLLARVMQRDCAQ